MGVEPLQFRNFSSCSEILHFVSTRNGGVSEGVFSSLNLGFHVGDEPSRVLTNRTRLMNAIGVPLESLVVGQQVHSANVAIICSDDRGRGSSSYESGIPCTDALVTANAGVCLMILVADCAPILIYDPRNHAIGAIHAGRVGVRKQIASKTIATMTREFGTMPSEVMVAIGPSIRGQHYGISADKVAELRLVLQHSSKSLSEIGGSYGFDLVQAHIEELCAIGVLQDNIERIEQSTYAMPELFFSERRDGKPTGRIGVGIMLC